MNSNCFVSPKVSVLDAMRQIDLDGRRIVFVAEDNKLLGVVTDGDIRRYILKSGNLNATVDVLMNRDPIVLKDDDAEQARKVFETSYVTAVPLVDEQNIIQKVYFWEDILGSRRRVVEKLEVPVVIMAGGKGTRLYPYTRILPKPLIPIGDTPIVERIINRFHGKGCTDFYMTVNYKKNMIKAYFNELEPPYSIKFVEELFPMGTGGSLQLLEGVLQSTFIMSNCDILVDCDYSDMLHHHKKSGNRITIVTSVKNHVIPYGVISLDSHERVEKITEKPSNSYLVNTGVYIMEPKVIEDIPKDKFYNITDLIDQYVRDGVGIGVYPVSENAWMDMGQPNEMEEMQKRLELHE